MIQLEEAASTTNSMKRKNEELYDPTNPDSDSDEDADESNKEEDEEKSIEPANKVQKGPGSTSIKLSIPSTIGKRTDSTANVSSDEDKKSPIESKDKSNGNQSSKTSSTVC